MASTNQYSINLGIGQLPETQDQNLFNELYKVYNSLHLLASSLDSYTGAVAKLESEWPDTPPSYSVLAQNGNRIYALYSETCGYGTIVNLYNDAGTPKIRKANATDNTKPAIGYCSVGTGVTAGNYGEVILGGLYIVSGATIGTIYYLSTVSGQLTSTKPAASGNIVQSIAYALSTTELYLRPEFGFTVV